MVKRLRYLRDRAGLSQKALADLIGVSQQSINKYENHNIEPDIDTLIALADVLGTSVDYLIGHSAANEEADHNSLYSLDLAEYALLCKYRSLRPGQKASIQMVIENFS